MLIIGLTGGIGSGKSVACSLFAQIGITIIDADLVARQLVAPGQIGLQKIIGTFGSGILTPKGTLDRSALRARIFSDPIARKHLEAILHPLIRKRMRAMLSSTTCPYVILAIPLLAETGHWDMLDRVLVIDAPRQLRLTRICRRDQIDEAQAAAILSAQCSSKERLNIADDVIYNTGAIDELQNQVFQVHNSYLILARQKAENPTVDNTKNVKSNHL